MKSTLFVFAVSFLLFPACSKEGTPFSSQQNQKTETVAISPQSNQESGNAKTSDSVAASTPSAKQETLDLSKIEDCESYGKGPDIYSTQPVSPEHLQEAQKLFMGVEGVKLCVDRSAKTQCSKDVYRFVTEDFSNAEKQVRLDYDAASWKSANESALDSQCRFH